MIDRLTRHVVVRFIISGGIAAFTDLVFLYVLNTVFGIYYLFSAILAFIGAFGVSFTLHKFWTFKSHDEQTHKQIILYLLASIFGLCLNTFFMYVFVDSFYLQVIVAQIITGAIVACFSFFISRNLVFKYTK